MFHIFDRFYRTDSSRARQTGGTGLGLSIAKWIADAHNGYFDVITREGVGTRITLCLPAAQDRGGNIDAFLDGDELKVVESSGRYEPRFKIVEIIEELREKTSPEN